MQIDESYEAKLAEIVNLHNNFASLLKRTERSADVMSVMVVNDLRYALRGSIDIIDLLIRPREESAYREDLERSADRVILALKIAYADALDFFIDETKILLDDGFRKYGEKLLTETNVSLEELRKSLASIEEKRLESRADRSRRLEAYSEIEKFHIHELIDVNRAISSFIDAEGARLLERQKKLTGLRLAAAIVIGLPLLYFFSPLYALLGAVAGLAVAEISGRKKWI